VHCRAMEPDEAPVVFDLVTRAFDDAVRPGFSAQGVAQFKLAARRFLLERRRATSFTSHS